MVIELPVAQHRPEYVFLTPATFDQHFINVVGPPGAPPLLDEEPLGEGTSLGASGLAAWSVPLGAGVHHLRAPDGASRYGLTVYGVATNASYAYPGGADVREVDLI